MHVKLKIRRQPPATSKLKRSLDVAVSLLALVVLSPVLLAVAILVVLDSGWPALFVQDRIGLDGRIFRIFKFRTMVQNAEKRGAGLWIRPGDDRFTRTGRFLRKTSLDELPQLWNVLRGEMSVVGPRPIHPITLPRLSLDQHGRHRTRPGLTGWAVLNGRNSIPYSRRFELDNWYIDHWSFAFDIRIILLTVPLVLRSEHVSMQQVEMEIDDLPPQPAASDAGTKAHACR